MTSRHLLWLTLLAFIVALAPVRADEGWVIDQFAIRYDIRPDGTIAVHEVIDVDFHGESRHGIFRDIVYRQRYDDTNDRVYDIRLSSVTDGNGRPLQVEESDGDAVRRFRIGDPDVTVSGKQTYRIAYEIRGALNAFTDHDELYWNASGTWPVQARSTSVVVAAPGEGIDRVQCFEGGEGSIVNCNAGFTGDQAIFSASRPLDAGEQLTIVVALRKGVVFEPQPQLRPRPRDLLHSFDRTPAIVGGMVAGLAIALVAIGRVWWKLGRDRRYVALHYLAQDNREETLPLFSSDPIVVEFEPPDRMRPGQIGLLIDERADTLDVTATIIDLAVRGYLKITEVPKDGWFSKADWQLTQLKPADSELLDYERIILNGLFDGGSPRDVSDLRNKFYKELEKAKTALYEDGVTRGWFPHNPNTVRTRSWAAGLVLLGAGAGLTMWLGQRWGAGLLGVPVVAAGVMVAMISRLLPRRSAAGREAMRRALGFARYIKTAETHQQAFAERAQIFTSYLPYAIAFKCVDRWARAFKDIDLVQATSSWYAGGTRFDSTSFSSTFSGFSSSMSSTLASTPGGSGGSGFGGSSGGGGGGGGGGSW